MRLHTLLPVLWLSFLAPSLLGQASAPVATSPPPDSTTAAASPAPAGQAPTDVMKRLFDLYHAGKFEEAHKLTEGLILAYPDDQRMVKIKALLAKRLSTTKSADAAPGNSPPASSIAQPAVTSPAAQLKGMDRVDYTALLDLMRQAQQTTDPDQQKALLKQFMNDSSAFLGKHPDQTKLWALRAESALSLDDITAGFEAGQKLLAVGAADSNDPNLLHLLGQLKNKGWMDEETVYTPGKNHKVTLPNAVPLDLVWISAGTFTMGSENGERDEKPVTRVTLTKPFWLGKTAVNQAQFEVVMGNNPSGFKGSDLPVEQVTWDDAMAFCRKLTEEERTAGLLPNAYEYTLPTEAQREYACRAGTTGDYAGNLDAMAWYSANAGRSTHPIGQKEPNAWGLYDMHGNVWEWCSDWYGERLPGGNATDPAGPSSGSVRVGRGGGWGVGATFCRSAARYGFVPDGRGCNLGFRVALSSVR